MAHDGAMIGLFIPEPASNDIAIKGGEKPEDLHITLAYLGNVTQYSQDERQKIVDAVTEVAKDSPPVFVKLGGYSRFSASESSGNKDVLHSPVKDDSPEDDNLDFLREKIVDAAEHAGAKISSEHEFNPHVTLQYVDPGSKVPENGPTNELEFPSLTIAFGDARINIPLEGRRSMAEPMDKDCYAYTPGDDPGGWKLRIDDAQHVAGAAAALSSGGFRGQKAQIPDSALEGVKAKVRAAWKKHNPDKSDDEMPESIKAAEPKGGMSQDDPDGDGIPDSEDPADNPSAEEDAKQAVKTPSAYLSKMKQLLKDKVSPEDFEAAHKTARAHAGGKAAAANKMQCFESQPDDALFRLFVETKAFSSSAPPEWIPYLPVPGQYSHPTYGKITLTKDRNANFVKNFSNGVYQTEVPIDAEHETKLGGAYAFVTAMRQNADGSVDAKVRWTNRGSTALSEGRFKYVSPEWYDNWTDPVTGQKFKDVAIGGAITNRPFFKEKALRPLVASECGIFVIDEARSSDDSVVMVELHKSEEGSQKMAEPTNGGEAANSELKALTEQLNKEKEASKALTERIARMEASARLQRFTEEVTGRSEDNSTPWVGDREKNIKLLVKMAEAFGEDSEEVKDFIAQNRAHSVQLTESGFFKEKGSSSSGAADPEQKVAAMAQKLMTENPKLSQAQAEAAVLRTAEGKQLYAQYDSKKMRRS